MVDNVGFRASRLVSVYSMLPLEKMANLAMAVYRYYFPSIFPSHYFPSHFPESLFPESFSRVVAFGRLWFFPVFCLYALCTPDHWMVQFRCREVRRCGAILVALSR